MAAEEPESPLYLRYVNEITSKYSADIERELGLIYIGGGGSMPYSVNEIEVNFVSHQRVSINQARELEVKCTEKLIQAINSHEKLRPFLSEFPFKANRAQVSISFNEKNGESYKDSLCYVFQVKNKIFYRAENPNNKNLYLSIGEESYEEALKLVQQGNK